MSELVNWNSFKAKYDRREQWAFENMAYFLFCSENDCPIGVFRYKNQPGIETEPIERDGSLVGFQAKYYDCSIAQKKNDIKNSIDEAKKFHPTISKLLFYINNEFSKNTQTKGAPKYKTEIEQYANSKNIIIDWRVPSQMEFQLVQPKNMWIRDIFFGKNGIDPVFFDLNLDKSIANLGERYNPTLNFELPIAQLFEALSHSKSYYDKMITIIDDWLTDKSYGRLSDFKCYDEIETELRTLKTELNGWAVSFHYSFDEPVVLDCFLERIRAINDKVRKKISEILRGDSKEKKDKWQRDNELYRLRDIVDSNSEFLNNIDKLNIYLSNNPTLIIQGEAGCGKSHLLGDIAARRKDLSLPTLLLLGTNFKNDTIETNILNVLELSCPFEEFANNLNELGLRMNTRVLLMIDAINEGPGPDLWKNSLAGFIKRLEKYPAIGLVLTIRSTYFHEIVPRSFQSDPTITIVEHEGFKGNEYEVLKMFCENYGLKLPNFPILNPEYANPLFLHLICRTVKESDDKTFPTGFNGIRNTLELYLDCLNKRFDSKRQEYRYRNIVTLAVGALAKAIFNSDYERLKTEDAFTLFDTTFSGFNNLLADLIEEGVIIKHHYQYLNEHFEYVVFSYQRIGDFFVVEELLKPYDTYEKLQDGFVKDVNLCKVKSSKWQYYGLLEAMSVYLPEKYNHELFELAEFFIDTSKTEHSRINIEKEDLYGCLADLLVNSLKWRSINSINSEIIIDWIDLHKCIDQDTWFYTLTELASITKHPFNSDYLHQLLLDLSMPIRDSILQRYLLFYSGYNDNNIAFPFRRLIDWAWVPGISIKTDVETVRLTAQALAWGLSSTKNTLRDQITKAMVNLLEQQPEALIATLKTFEKVDDLYILERLYAVAYGCVLRTEKDESISIIAKFVYETIFKNGQPPIHVLLRDYARNIVEYALYRNLISNVEVQLIRPPYKSDKPIFPDSMEIQQYHLDFNDPLFKTTYGYENNTIYNSVVGGLADFGHYIVEYAVSKFSSITLNEKREYTMFYNSFGKKTKENLDCLFECQSGIAQKKLSRSRTNDNSSLIEYAINLLHDNSISELQNQLSKDQFDYLQDVVIPYFDKVKGKTELDTWGARCWIVKRVFELGYDRLIHGKYDSHALRFNDRLENKVERIGKKYQWIAYHELMARITDNYCMIDKWNKDISICYKGPWQLYLRNIDPIYIKKTEDKKGEISTMEEWWGDDGYYSWNVPDDEWVNSLEDLVPITNVLEKRDENGQEWIRLSHDVSWNEPKRIGEDRYVGKQINYLIQAFIVKKSDKQKIVKYLSGLNFWGRWLPENGDNDLLFSREKYWSPAYVDVSAENEMWPTIRNTDFHVMIADEVSKGSIENDKSGSNQRYRIPCKLLFEGLALHYASTDGELKNEKGEIIVINMDENGCLIKKKELLDFLRKKHLDIIWTVLGEKISVYGITFSTPFFKVPCGVFYLENGGLKGDLKIYDRD